MLMGGLNNVKYYRLRTMSYLDIQKWKEAMKTLDFQQGIRGTYAYTNRLIRGSKGCG